MSKFAEECLNAHNEFRKIHGVPPLKLDKKLCSYAEEWVHKLVEKGRPEHRDQQEYGENIFYKKSTDPNFTVTPKEPVQAWYNEIKDFKFGQEPTSMGTGHFTQVVWEDTKLLGVGYGKTKDGSTAYVVCNYSPPGNFMGQFKTKVKPPKK